MTESTPPTLEQSRQLQRSLTEKVLDKAASDPQWRQRLLEDSEAAMRDAGFPEVERLAEIDQASRPRSQEGEEVRGQQWLPWYPGGGYGYCPWYCYWYTYYWDRPWWSWYGGGGGPGW